jgi:hypothetical protein
LAVCWEKRGGDECDEDWFFDAFFRREMSMGMGGLRS